ncbi:hypothetical protein DRN67_00815 [Candidatus Micrarchaeota archaeon]|nr:MAG: hypothetical protein DRN67_00815 [Candidatus Micrarchaeota archaeon]
MVAILLVLMLASMVYAQSIASHVIFVVPSYVSFRMTVMGTPLGVNSTGGQNASLATSAIMFNATLMNISLTGNNVGKVFDDHLNASRNPAGTGGVAPPVQGITADTGNILNYTNTGNVNVTITMVLGDNLPAWAEFNHTIRMYASNVSGVTDFSTITCTNPADAPNGLDSAVDCVYINGTNVAYVSRNLSVGTTENIWLWADFVNLSFGSWTRNVTSFGSST